MTRIAFCGPNMSLNESLTQKTVDFLYEEGVDIVTLPNPVQHCMDLTGRERFESHDIDWMNLWGASMRRMMIEGSKEAKVLLSASCGIDEVCMQATWLGEQIEAQNGAMTLVDAKGTPLVGNDGVMVNRSGAVLQSILNSTEEEVSIWWDFIYAVLPVTMEASSTPDIILTQYRDFLASVPVLQDVVRLPDNEEAAVDALKNEVERWKEKQDSSS